MKKNLFILILISILFVPTFVFAKEETYYTNDNGVSLTEKEYNFISELYYEGFQKHITKELYDDLKSDDIFSHEIESKSVEYNPKQTRGTFIEDTGRKLRISKVCTSNCLITVLYDWKGEPTIKSYDVMGAYFDRTKLENSPFTVIESSVDYGLLEDYKKESNGLGCSFKLIEGSDIKLTQSFRVSVGGHVYASYQHALKPSTLALSKDYKFSLYGHGNVFEFSATARNYYDDMNGVDIEV